MRRSIALLLCALVVLSAAGSNRKKLSPAELVAENAAKKVAKAERDALIQYTLKLLTDARRFMAEAQNIMLNDVTVDTVGMKKIFSAIEYITRTSGTLMKATYKLTDLDLYHEIEPKIPSSFPVVHTQSAFEGVHNPHVIRQQRIDLLQQAHVTKAALELECLRESQNIKLVEDSLDYIEELLRRAREQHAIKKAELLHKMHCIQQMVLDLNNFGKQLGIPPSCQVNPELGTVLMSSGNQKPSPSRPLGFPNLITTIPPASPITATPRDPYLIMDLQPGEATVTPESSVSLVTTQSKPCAPPTKVSVLNND
ncbi:hypothetical protein QR680_010978 [Steinernema hermaphroditum]|uniref:Uncharacterized protein n=1 Tax=Steinernema hermaphroditum TaxID=289476 RepID=A0AA39MCK4_9BILA|nr:hypothetical protein QR680_010978 [Steinernema hermaphroditum]